MNRIVQRFRNAFRTGIFSSGSVNPPTPETSLRRESDGKVTVLSLANTFTPTLTRESDGSVTIGAA